MSEDNDCILDSRLWKFGKIIIQIIPYLYI